SPLGYAGRKAFIPQDDVPAGGLREFLGKSLDFLRLRPPAAVGAQRKAHDDPSDVVRIAKLPDMLEVFLASPPPPHAQPLGRQAQRVAHGDADALLSHIQTQQAS